MEQYFEELKAMALDPFSQQLVLRRVGPRKLAAHDAGASPHAAQVIANGPWAQSECCCDPGPDEFPEIEARAASTIHTDARRR